MRDDRSLRAVTAALVCLGAIWPAEAKAREAVAGVVIDLKGKPTVERPGEKGRPLKRNEMVYEKDMLETGPGECAAVAFVGGAELRINESSKFVMESGGGRKEASVFTEAGQAWTRPFHKGAAGIRVGSPLAVAETLDSEMDVEVRSGMTVKAYTGDAAVWNDSGRQTLRAEEMTRVSGGGQAPEAPRKLDKPQYGSWQDCVSAHRRADVRLPIRQSPRQTPQNPPAAGAPLPLPVYWPQGSAGAGSTGP